MKKTNWRACQAAFTACLSALLAAAPAFAQQAKKAKKMADKPAAPGKPAITRIEPRGLQRGATVRIKLTGTNLVGLTELKLPSDKLKGRLLANPAPQSNAAWIEITAAADLVRSAQEFSVIGGGGESAPVKLFVDDLPQVYETASDQAAEWTRVDTLPASFWGTLDPKGDVDQINFNAKAGQTIVFDLEARVLGSRAANAMLTLLDASGRVLASNAGFDETGDPFIAHRFEKSGRYGVRASDLTLGASPDHFYRLSIGAFPHVTGVFPIGAAVGAETSVELIGHNLPRQALAIVKPENPGEVTVPIDAEKYRSRRAFKVLAAEGTELIETEPNDEPTKANPLPLPAAVNGRIQPTRKGQDTDVDLFRFRATKGQQVALQTVASRRGSPLDTKLEVLRADGRPVERLLLQAVRDSAINFRPIDSAQIEARVDNWEEMDLNQLLYLEGEVCRITRMPRGPDSGINFYSSGGKRRAWFDTTATAHALETACYIVEPHPLGARLVPNGLPVFTLNYANDDDGDRELGSDSRLLFTAPADGDYLVRVSDSRGLAGDLFAYRLVVREARPDFNVTLVGVNPKVPPGNGVGFLVRADRIDGFSGEIRVDVSDVPSGFVASTPVVIQADHLEADGTLFAQHDAKTPAEEEGRRIKITATATINGQTVTKSVNGFGRITLAEPPKLFVRLEPEGAPAVPATNLPASARPPEIVIAPGQTVPAWLRVERHGETNLVNLDVDNLPHGIIVDNIGLNGVQVRAGENEREIFLNARPWVPEQERLCHAVLGSARASDGNAGKQTSFPVLIKVRKAASPSTAGVAQGSNTAR